MDTDDLRDFEDQYPHVPPSSTANVIPGYDIIPDIIPDTCHSDIIPDIWPDVIHDIWYRTDWFHPWIRKLPLLSQAVQGPAWQQTICRNISQERDSNSTSLP